jgi:glutamine---fructose-6-phosphate transaminase (isomerizing)
MDKGQTPAATPGTFTRSEILSQPRCWAECFRDLDEPHLLQRVARELAAPRDWLFIGCGSSYYAALGAAASWTALTGLPARAAPASELLLFPDLLLPAARPCQPVLISRSGHTSEVLKVAEQLELQRNLRTLAITCVAHQPLEEICATTLHLLPADEQSMVMTRSFTSMLLALQALAAERGAQKELAAALRRLPEQTAPGLEAWAGSIEQFVAAQQFADYVFLGQGPFYALASEAMLKVKEMSCSYAQCFHTLEFRHGPKAIVSPQTLVTFLLSERGYEAEREVLEDVKGLGGRTLVVTNRADPATRQAADLLVELELEVPEYARLVAYALPGQLLGLYTGLKKGFDPDRPRNLSRVVILNDR